MTQTPKEKAPRVSDLVKWEANQLHTREVIAIQGEDISEGEDIALAEMFGHPVNRTAGAGVLLLAAGIANCDAIIISQGPLTIAKGGEVEGVTVIARGPAMLNFDQLPAKDYADSAINAANFQAAIEVMGCSIIREPAKTETLGI